MTEIAHDKTPDQHSSIVGGSSAARILGCPGSVDLLAKIPESVRNRSSSYADEGTALHEVMAYLVENDVPYNGELINDPKIDELFAKYGVDEKRFFDAVVPAYRMFNEYLDAICAADGEDFMVRVESRVEMPGIEGAFGTADILIKTPKRTVVWDWKFGAGVPVYASYKLTKRDNGEETHEEEFGNDQLMFYARAALHTHTDYFDESGGGGWPVDLVICQPRILDDIAIFTTDVAALEDFRLDLVDAVEEALSGKGKLAVGKYCRFEACKSICPLHLNGPEAAATIAEKLNRLKDQSLTQADLAAAQDVEIIPPGADAPVRMRLDAGRMYAMLLDLKEMLDPLLAGGAADAHKFLEAGGIIPGYKLVPKKAGWDKWAEPREKVDGFLARQGLELEARREPWEPISPAQARTKLKAAGKDMKDGSKERNLLEKYVQKGVSSGTTLAPESDSRPAVESTAGAIGALANKIAALGTA